MAYVLCKIHEYVTGKYLPKYIKIVSGIISIFRSKIMKIFNLILNELSEWYLYVL